MFSVTGLLEFEAAALPVLELLGLLLPHAARPRAPTPIAPTRSASRLVIKLSVIMSPPLLTPALHGGTTLPPRPPSGAAPTSPPVPAHLVRWACQRVWDPQRLRSRC